MGNRARGFAWLALAALAACDNSEPAADGTSATETQAVEVQAVAEAPAAVSTGDAVLDEIILRIEADGREEQVALRTFSAMPASALFDPRPGDGGFLEGPVEEQSPEHVELVRSFLAEQLPAAAREQAAAAGGARVLMAEECGARTDEALGVPDGFFPNWSGGIMLDRARLISALRGEGVAEADIAEILPALGDDTDRAAINLALANAHAAGKTREPLVRLDFSDGCGAGEIWVEFRTDPPATTLRIIPEFFFAICEKQNVDAWSNQKCRWWQDVLKGGEMVAGSYNYYARTADGETRSGRFRVTEQRLIGPDGMPAEVLNIRL